MYAAGTLPFMRKHAVVIALAVACASVWSFVLYDNRMAWDWLLLALALYECIRGLRLARERDRAIRDAASPAEARRIEAQAFLWDDRRIERIVSDARRDDGPEVASARAATPFLQRPARGFGYVAALALRVVVFGLVVVLNR